MNIPPYDPWGDLYGPMDFGPTGTKIVLAVIVIIALVSMTVALYGV